MAVGAKLQDFKSNLKEAARPNRFIMSFVTPPAIDEFSEEMQYHVKSASIPTRTVGDITLNWQGLQTKIAGDPTYDDYTVGFLNNENFNIRALFEKWSDLISGGVENTRAAHGDYMAVARIDQLSRSGNEVIATYYMHGIWPKSIAAIELSQESTNAIEEFEVTFNMDFFSNSASPASGEAIVKK